MKYWKDDLLYHPCRGQPLQSLLSDIFLSGDMFPHNRPLEGYLGNSTYEFAQTGIDIPIRLGMGPFFRWRARAIICADTLKLIHQHIVYPWPPTPEPDGSNGLAVFPAILGDTTNLKALLDERLAILVDDYFDEFPLYHSPLRVLYEIYALYKSLERVGALRSLLVCSGLMICSHETVCFISLSNFWYSCTRAETSP